MYRIRLLQMILCAGVVLFGLFLHLPTAEADYVVLTDVEPSGRWDVSVDGQYMVYGDVNDEGTKIFRITVATGERELLYSDTTRTLGDVRIVSNSQKIYFTRGQNLYRLSWTGGTPVLVMPYTAGYFGSALATSDEQYLIFRGPGNSGRPAFYVLDTQNDTLQGSAFTEPFESIEIILSADENQILFAPLILVDGMPFSQLLTTPLGGGSVTSLYPYSQATISQLRGSVDSNHVLYAVTTTDGIQQTRLYQSQLTGTVPEVVNDSWRSIGSILISPDRQYAFFAGQTSGTKASVYRLALADLTLDTLYTTTTRAEDNYLRLMAPAGHPYLVIANANSGIDDQTVSVYAVSYEPISTPHLLTHAYGANWEANPNDDSLIPLFVDPDDPALIFTDPEGTAFYLNRVPLDGSVSAERLIEEPIVQNVRLSISSKGNGLFLETVDMQNSPFEQVEYLSLDTLDRELLFYENDPARSFREIAFGESLPNEQLLVLSGSNRVGLPDSNAIWKVGRIPMARFATKQQISVAEGVDRAITVELLPASTQPLTIGYDILTGTATLGVDFTLTPTELVFMPGQSTQTLTISTTADDMSEPIEAITLQLTGSPLPTPMTTTISIADTVYPISDAPAILGTASTTGRYAIFYEQTSNGLELFTKDMVTGQRFLVSSTTDTLSETGTVVLSPDDQNLFYVTTTQLRRVPLLGGESLNVIATNGCDSTLKFTPDSQYAGILLNCAEGNDTLGVLNLITSEWRPIAIAPNITSFALRDDGTYLVARYLDSEGNFTFFTVWNLITNTEHYISASEGIILFADFTAYGLDYLVSVDGNGTILRVPLPYTTPVPVVSLHLWENGVSGLNSRRDTFYTFSGITVNRINLALGTQYPVSLTFPPEYTAWLNQVEIAPTGGTLLAQGSTQSCHRYGCDDGSFVVSISPDDGIGILSSGSGFFNENYLALFSSDGKFGVSNSHGIKVHTFSDVPVSHHLPITLGTPSAFAVGSRTLLFQGYEYGNPHTNGIYRTRLNTRETTPVFWDPFGARPLLTRPDDVFYFQDSDGYLYMTGQPTPEIAFAPATTLTAEGTVYSATVTLASTPFSTVTVAYEFTGGSATPGDDFSFTPGTLTFAPFEQSKTIPIEIIADSVVEPSESATFSLSNITGGIAGEATTITITLADEVHRRWLPILHLD